ncbi:MAG TPA: ABC transporter permease [Acetobacteraceae bacterium]|nr:ABC transporter permease [Acetobacteraceae bacterium]
MWHDLLLHLGGGQFLAALLRVSTPILLAALGALISDRAGVINIGIEGIMLAGAFAGVVGSAATGSAWIGLLAAILAGALLGAALSAAVHGLKADLVLSGVALNLACASGTVLLLFALTGDKGMSGSLPSKVLPNIDLPFLDGVPVLGTAFGHQHVLTWASLLAVPCVSVLLMKTPFGLRLRAVGENAEAAAIAGVRVARVQFAALVLSGAFGGVAGAFLSMGYVSWFTGGMSAGRGFIAIAAEVMGGGMALGTCVSALVLGAAEAFATDLQGIGLPSELMQTVPYIVPVVALVLHAARRRRAAA